MPLEEQAGWISLGAVVIALVFILGVLVGGRDNPRTVSLKHPNYNAPVVKNGVAAVMLCGEMRDAPSLGLTEKALGKGTWTAPPPQEGCQVWYQSSHPDEEWYREGTGGSPTTGPASWYWYWGGGE